MSEHLAIAICGRKHTGKSTFARNMLLKLNHKVVIVDPNGSPAYNQIQKIEVSKLRTLKSGIVKIYTPNPKQLFEELWDIMHDKNGDPIRWNGTILFDDATKYIDSKPSEKVKSILVDHRMYSLNLLFTFHAISFIPPFFWKMLTNIVLLKTQDLMEENYREYSKKIPNFTEIYSEWMEVMASKDPYAHAIVKTLI
jgi:ABC-type phosphate/phosphonate transport system ATPase subunit